MAISLCYQDVDNERRDLEIPSPDKSVTLVVKGSDGSFYMKGRPIGTSFLMVRDEEVIWSPDSKALISTFTLSASGPSFASIVYVHPDSLIDYPQITALIRKDFSARHPKMVCHEVASVSGLSWSDSSKEANFIAQIDPSPHCEPDDGYFDVYSVPISTGDILGRYSMKEAGKRWHEILGLELRQYLRQKKSQ